MVVCVIGEGIVLYCNGEVVAMWYIVDPWDP